MRERWYRHGPLYAVSVRAFADGDGDGVGDLRGLIGRLEHIAALGARCLWLLPFYPSPWRDDGYDVSDHYAVHPQLGTLGDFVELVHRAEDLGLRVVVDLVLNHTSNRHPWFQAARAGDPRYRDWFVWAEQRPADAEKGIVFPGVQKTTWTFDRRARAYYFHRFYPFQPDLNVDNEQVRAEMRRVVEFWLQLGVAGFRVDAVPFLIEPVRAGDERPGPRFEFLHELRNHLSWRRGDAVLLGEANVERDAIEDYFGIGGMHMLFNFTANQQLWLALAREDARPLLGALAQTSGIPASDQWATFLRNHDELDLGRLASDERADVFAAFAPQPRMQLYGRGIRRRLAPMLGNDRRRLELALSLLLALPGTPVLLYGDEIGMGDDLAQPERQALRTAMQWDAGRNGGFSTAPASALRVPIVRSGPYAYSKVNVAAQELDESSLLRWLTRALRVEASCPELGEGDWEALDTGERSVVALRHRLEGSELVTLHNLAGAPRRPRLDLGEPPPKLVQLHGNADAGDPRPPYVDLDAYGYRWLRVAAASR